MAANDQLIGFVRDALARGVERPRVEAALKQAGWDPKQVSAALGAFAAVDFPIPVPRPRTSLSAREAHRNTSLPSSLEALRTETGTNITIADPATGASYEFRTLEGEQYELCAAFEGESGDSDRFIGAGFWSHRAGRQCFQRDAMSVR